MKSLNKGNIIQWYFESKINVVKLLWQTMDIILIVIIELKIVAINFIMRNSLYCSIYTKVSMEANLENWSKFPHRAAR